MGKINKPKLQKDDKGTGAKAINVIGQIAAPIVNGPGDLAVRITFAIIAIANVAGVAMVIAVMTGGKPEYGMVLAGGLLFCDFLSAMAFLLKKKEATYAVQTEARNLDELYRQNPKPKRKLEN